MFGLSAVRLAIYGAAFLIVAAGIVSAVAWLVDSGRDQVKLEMAQKAADAERERIKDDTELRRLSDRELCTRALISRGMPVDSCADL